VYIYKINAPIHSADLLLQSLQQQIPALNREKDCARKARAVLHELEF
jgi:hypothetical protein